MATHTSTADDLTGLSSSFLLDLLAGAIEQENEKIDDIHMLAIDGASMCRERDQSVPGAQLAIIDRVLEPSGNRYLVDRIIQEMKRRGATASSDTKPTERPAARAAIDRTYLTRQAMSNLLMAAMEMHTTTGRTDAAFVLTEKALAAIGALRVVTKGGRIQA